jgi:uncharacterized membrane protein YecN with MAPEG domain
VIVTALAEALGARNAVVHILSAALLAARLASAYAQLKPT